MEDKPLKDLKIAVLVENQYIPVEVQAYCKSFADLGATVHLMSRLWNQPSQEFVSELEKDDAENLRNGSLTLAQMPQFIKANVAVETARASDYAAVIMAANYTSVRLLYYTAHETNRSTPAAKFFADAMRDRRIIKGALCHGLIILTPYTELLACRKVICHEVVRPFIENCGADIWFPLNPKQATGTEWVVADGDLITGHSYHEVADFIELICKQVLEARKSATPPWVDTTPLFSLDGIKPSHRKILVLVSEWGYWGEELVGPVEVFDAAGYETVFVTPTGRRPNAITVSMDSDYVDPPLGRPVTSTEMAEKVKCWDDPTSAEGQRLERPLNLSEPEWFPERPYFSAAVILRQLEDYFIRLYRAEQSIETYDALLIVGGSGPLVDLCNNQRVHDLILAFYKSGKPIAAECYGVTCLAFARDWETRESIIRGKHVTGHCKEYDYKDGTGFMESRGKFLSFNMGPPPYPLEYILRDATAPGGQYHGNVGHKTSVIVDYPFITGRSTPDSYFTGQKIVEVLEIALKRYGW